MNTHLSPDALQACLAHFPRLAFVDLETTGGAPTADRITEVGIVEVDADGVREWSSLVNPEASIPPFIQQLTGITNEMVAGAPTFAELADEIHARLQGRVFVAHNARFDHGFLKNEFKRTGHAFRPEVVCTVKLSRKLYPGEAKHNLDSIVARHGLVIEGGRHRALGDTRAIWQFWQQVCATQPAEAIGAALKKVSSRPTLPSHLDETLPDRLPARPGVYLFYGEPPAPGTGDELPLYIGKANSIRSRVLSHFSGDHGSSKEMNLSQQVRRIEWIETGGELGALLKEAELVKAMHPTLNQRLRRNRDICAWRIGPPADGPGHSAGAPPDNSPDAAPPTVTLIAAEALFDHPQARYFGPHTSRRKALAALRELAETQGLCTGVLGLDKLAAGKPCFGYQLRRCAGTCVGEESLASHHARLAHLLADEELQAWPYAGAVGLRENGVLHVVAHWAYLGTARDEAEALSLAENRPVFDRDVYMLLRTWLRRLPVVELTARPDR